MPPGTIRTERYAFEQTLARGTMPGCSVPAALPGNKFVRARDASDTYGAQAVINGRHGRASSRFGGGRAAAEHDAKSMHWVRDVSHCKMIRATHQRDKDTGKGKARAQWTSKRVRVVTNC